MGRRMKIEKFFPVGIAEHFLDKELADKIEGKIVPLLKNLERGQDQYTDFFENKIKVPEVVPELIQEIINGINYYRTETSLAINPNAPLQYWTQDYKEGDIHGAHSHGVSGISGIYWVRANESAGGVKFFNPNPITEYVSVETPDNPYAWTYTVVKPEKGKMILFPSYLKHEVLPSGKDVIRTSIPFNVAG
jgi:hypothetical protein